MKLQVLWTASEVSFAQVLIPNKGTDSAYAKEEWMEWFACEVSKTSYTFSWNNLKVIGKTPFFS